MFNRTIPFIAELRREERDPCENVKQANLSTVGSSRMFPSRATNPLGSISSYPTEAVSNNFQEPRPMDHIYYFHKAIITRPTETRRVKGRNKFLWNTVLRV